MNLQKKNETFDYMIIGIMVIILGVILYPLWFVVIASISEPNLVSTGEVVIWPKGLTLIGYEKVIAESTIWRGYLNSIVYTILYTALGLAMILPAAYGFSRKGLLLSPYLMSLFIFTMFFGGGLIPTYLLIKNLGMQNTMWALIVPGSISVYNMIVARTFFSSSISYEIQESAKIDGCSDFAIFLRIVLPLSKAIIAVLGLYYAVGMWNSYFTALIYISDEAKYPLQLVLREILFKNQSLSSVMDVSDPLAAEELNRITQLVKYVLMIVASVPMFLAYPFIQKYFVKGVMIGSIKG